MEQDQIVNQSQYEQEKGLIVLAINISYTNERTINCSVYDKNKRAFYVTQFNDNQYFSSLEGMLIQLNPKDMDTQFRVIYTLPELNTEIQKLNQLFSGVETTQFSSIVQKKKIDIQRLLEFLLDKELNHYYIHTNNSKNMNILGKMIEQLKLENDTTNKKKMRLQQINMTKYMKLDHAAISALQIFPKSQQKKVISSNQTLFDLICKCKTSIGIRCLKRWMKQPLQNDEEINKRLDFVDYFMRNVQMRNYIQNQVLNSVCDLQKLYFTFYKVASQKPCKTQMNDLIKIFKLVKTLQRFIEKMSQKQMSQFQKTNIYDVLVDNVKILSSPVMMIEKNVVMEGRQSEYYIKPSTQKALYDIMEEKKKVLQEINDQEKRVKKELKIDIELIQMGHQNQTYIFQGAKQKVQEAIRSRGGKQYKHGTIRGKKMTFKSTILIQLTEELKEIQNKYKMEQKIILNKMIKAIATYYEILQKVSEILSYLDIFTSWALFLSSESLSAWCRPTFGSQLVIKQVRHPCVYNCISSDLQLVGNQKCALITGPNMGGKSTFIRMIGISVYLSHIGFYVPAYSFESPIIDAIITRVGASDAQLQGVSTFMNEMLQSSCALSSATNKSLVLIDELGRGTSTHEGFGIAWGICQYLHTKIHAYCLFATHFHELTLMADQVDGVINLHASCNVTNDNIFMNYKIIPGKSEMSYGIQLIKSMQFPDRIVEYAQEFYDGLENFQHNTPHKRKSQELTEKDLSSQFLKMNIEENHQYQIRRSGTDERAKMKMKNLLSGRGISFELKSKIVQESQRMILSGASTQQVHEFIKTNLGL